MTIAILIVLLGVLGWSFWRITRAYLKFRGKRVVTCPATDEPAAVDLTTWHIAIASTFGHPHLHVRDCSRWRQVARCNGPCLAQIEEAPEKYLVQTILSNWYEGKACTCCGSPVGDVSRWHHKPCVMSPDMRISEWKDIPAENIPLVLGTHAPVCWKCLVAETHIN